MFRIFFIQAIVNKKSSFHDSRISVRRFDSFGFLKCVKIAYNEPHTSKVSRPHNTKKHFNDPAEDSSDSDRETNVDDHHRKFHSRSQSNSRAKHHNEHAENDDTHFQWFSISVPSVDRQTLLKVRLAFKVQ